MPPSQTILQAEVMLSARSRFRKKGLRNVVNFCWLIWLAVNVPLTAKKMIRIDRPKVQRLTSLYWVSKSVLGQSMLRRGRPLRVSMYPSDKVN